MEPLGGVAVGIDAGVVRCEGFHLVEAVLDRVGIRLVAKMPFSREIRRVAVLFEEFGDRRCPIHLLAGWASRGCFGNLADRGLIGV